MRINNMVCMVTTFMILMLIFFISYSRSFKFFDQAKQSQSFYKFRGKLIKAIKEKNRKYLLSIVSEKIKISGGDSGKKAFIQFWGLDKPGATLWKEFGAVLKLGGCLREKSTTFQAPYFSCKHFEGMNEAEVGIVIGTGVRLRSKPGLDSKILKKLNYEVVTVKNWETIKNKSKGKTLEWNKVKLDDGTVGYIVNDYLRNQSDYSATFVYKNNRWLLSDFSGGY